jgi:riboflavin kinase / FMN adenylyltransferase
VLTIRHTEHFRINSPSIVTIGTFDGVHHGHKKILQRLGELKVSEGFQTVVLTFDPHPRKVLFPEQKDLKLLTSVDEKLKLLADNNIDITVVYPFTADFAKMDAHRYIEYILVKSLRVKMLVIGYDHKFGNARSGDISVLRKFSGQFGYSVEEIPARDIDNISVSSSKIRKALEEGNLRQASGFLGYDYHVTGKVVRGKQLGRTLGFPTANLRLTDEDKLVPKPGIYFVKAGISGTEHYGMMSIGINPTTDTDDTLKLEVNIFDFDADIYDSIINVTFLERLRDEKKFGSLAELTDALQQDRAQCLKLIDSKECAF